MGIYSQIIAILWDFCDQKIIKIQHYYKFLAKRLQ